ncbi:S-layer homology domain-containing protein [Paenibacillus guangzhouensis]|uniref:S-layer homology domain-containing protein n=1 Tax=Paenibacillus guangzhouensis TaxID=1473112 RepID=UPI001D10684A|nr:S-layer homology domain-containing protein [Paenibacillus guangzhouensis]
MSVTKYIKGAVIGLSIAAISLASMPKTEANNHRFAMSYIYFGKPDQYLQAVNQTKGSLDMVSPSYFDLNDNGSLQLTDAVDPKFVEEMHKQGMKVVPFLSNHWDRKLGIAALNNREALTKQIAAAIEKYNLDGVNVDIENVTEKQRDDYTALVKMLRAAIPANKEVSVAVAANPDGWNTGWHGSYDYAALGKVSDYLMLMTYDESYEGGEPGPVASLPFVKKSIEYALKHVPSDKIVMGIPFYGRYWKSDGSIQGLGIQNTVVNSLIEKYNGKVVFDAASQSPKATFTIPASDPGASVHGKRITAGTYTVWYENEQSIKAKLGLVQKYNLKGAGNWSLNEESGNTWDYYSKWLNDAAYLDTVSHWADEAIQFVSDKGWMAGTGNRLFEPKAPLTRAQAASVLVRMSGEKLQPGSQTALFKDVPSNHWAAADIQIAKQRGLINGYEDGRFAPNQTVTREELAAMLAKALQQKPALRASAVFTDVDSNRWSASAITSLSQRGVISGYQDGTFRPTRAVTRAELAVMLQAATTIPS